MTEDEIAVRRFPCGYCHAEPQEPCRTRNSHGYLTPGYPTTLHRDRVMRWSHAVNDAPVPHAALSPGQLRAVLREIQRVASAVPLTYSAIERQLRHRFQTRS